MAIEATTTLPQSFHIGQRVQAHPAPLWMLRVLAQQQAKARVRDEIKRCGYKITSTTAAQITEMARDYISQHHDELFARAVRKGISNRTVASGQARNVEASRR
jgi:hypothetical protein